VQVVHGVGGQLIRARAQCYLGRAHWARCVSQAVLLQWLLGGVVASPDVENRARVGHDLGPRERI
jgi:hypothetical protein